MQKIIHSNSERACTGFLLSLIFCALASLGCSKGLESFKAQKQSAPRSPDQLGILITKTEATSLAKFLNKYPEARYRPLDSAQGFYEVFNSSLKVVQSELDAEAVNNEWMSPEESPLFKKLEVESGKLESTEGDGMMITHCFRDSAAPIAKIKLIEPDISLRLDRPVELGTEVVFAGEASAHVLNPSPLTMAFALVAPGEEGPQTVKFGDELRFKTTAMGVYQIVFIVQDNRGVCTMVRTSISVTANREFIGHNADTSAALADLDLKKFEHLERIQAEKAWEISQGEDVVIAIVDTGVNYNHPALVKNIFTNENEIPGNGIDDDGNGFIDDYLGYDFMNDDPYPYDDEGHGTHVAGLAASSEFGVAKKARILSIKGNSAIGTDIGTFAASIRYAVKRKAKIISLSMGSYGAAPRALVDALKLAEKEGMLVVAASGNGHPFFGTGLDTDKTPIYPASFKNENILSMAATAKEVDGLAPYSNFGIESVDLAAPGGMEDRDLILSCEIENSKGQLFKGRFGTSMATPLAAGTAALLLALKPDLKPTEIINHLMNTADPVPSLQSKIKSGGALNAHSAVERLRN